MLKNKKKQKKDFKLNINVPKLDDESIAKYGILQLNSQMERRSMELLAEERQKHRGYPNLNKQNKLDLLKCNYPECGKVFNCRDHLFRHLNRMIDPQRMINSHHQKHFKLVVRDNERDSTICKGCGEVFESAQDCHQHYAIMGTPRFRLNEKQNNSKKKDAPKVVDQYENPDECVICMDAKRSVVNVPCGHLVLCNICGPTVKQCPICRANIVDVLTVYYS